MGRSAVGRSSWVYPLVTRALFGSRFATIWLASGLLLLIAWAVAPNTLSSASWSNMLPIGSVVALVALGQMLVIMTGGIDLSMAATMSLLANVLVGTAAGEAGRLDRAVLVVLGLAVVIGLANGLLVAVVELNPLIVTLATGLALLGFSSEYRSNNTSRTAVPDELADLVFEKILGISVTFWFVLVVLLVITALLRATTAGRRFQSVGANRRAAWIAGIRVRAYVVFAYVAAAVMAGVAGVAIAGILVSPGVDPGASYLLGPVAAVVLAGAAISGGLASPTSTWAAAFFVTVLRQLLRVIGLSVASELVVFGLAIILGMLISGDRIADLIGRTLLHQRVRALVGIESGQGQGGPADGDRLDGQQSGGERVDGRQVGGQPSDTAPGIASPEPVGTGAGQGRPGLSDERGAT